MDRVDRLRRGGRQSGRRPSVFGGTDYTGFYTASGYVTFIGQAAMFIWFTVATVATLVRRTETPVVVTVDR
jgi:hypothetical protein